MVVKNIIDEMLPNIWPMVAFISIVAITLRCAYLFKGSRKFVLHKELLSLVFIIYILCLYYILMGQDGTSGGVNLIPFKEILRYPVGSTNFYRQVIGNIVLFIPFGFFASYYTKTNRLGTISFITFLVSLTIEVVQKYIGRSFDVDDIILNVVGGILGFLIFVALDAIKRKLPKFLQRDGFYNFFSILLVIFVALYLTGIIKLW